MGPRYVPLAVIVAISLVPHLIVAQISQSVYKAIINDTTAPSTSLFTIDVAGSSSEYVFLVAGEMSTGFAVNSNGVVSINQSMSIGRYEFTLSALQMISFELYTAIALVDVISLSNPCDNQLLYGRCSHICIEDSSNPHTYSCQCHSGYSLQRNGYICRANDPEPSLLFSYANGLAKLDTFTRAVNPIISDVAIVAFDYHYGYQVIYYSVDNTVYSVSITGQNPRIVYEGSDDISSIAVNWLNSDVYFTSGGTIGRIIVAPIVITTTILSSLSSPRHLVLDAEDGVMYWTEGGDSDATIRRAALNGTNIVTISTNVNGSQDLSVDTIEHRVYWNAVSGNVYQILSSSENGDDVNVVFDSTLFQSGSLSVFEDYIYSSKVTTQLICRVDKYTRRFIVNVTLSAGEDVNTIKVYHRLKQPNSVEDENECATGNGGCNQTCTNLVGGSSCGCYAGYQQNGDSCEVPAICSQSGCQHSCVVDSSNITSCICNPGYELSDDGVTCTDIDECTTSSVCSHQCSNTMGSFTCSCPDGLFLDDNGRSCSGCGINNGGCDQICTQDSMGFTCSCLNDYVLGNDGKRCHYGEIPELLLSTTQTGLNRGRVYVTESDGTELERNVDSSNTVLGIVTGMIFAMEYNLGTGKIYFSDRRNSSFWMASLDNEILGADDREHLLMNANAWAFTYDWITETLYWSDDMNNRIGRVTLNPVGTAQYFSTTGSPRGIAVDPFRQKVFWSEVGPSSIQSSDLQVQSSETIISGVNQPFGLTIDILRERIFFVDNSSNFYSIYSTNYNGEEMDTIVENHTSGILFQIAYADGFLYWTVKTQQVFQRVEVDSASPTVTQLAVSLRTESESQSQLYSLVAVSTIHRPPAGVCLPNPCQNGGLCAIDGLSSYTCNCRGNYFGSNCTMVNHCMINPCENGGTCSLSSEAVNGFSCQCPSGYLGDTCEQEDFCRNDPCENGGTCQNEPDGYVCGCAVGYTGDACAGNIDDCIGIVCGNGGVCEDLINAFRCNCVDGYTGPNCTVNIDNCEGIVCGNGGICEDLVNRFRCNCADGYTGPNCTVNIDDCEDVVCGNGGVCEDLINAFRCNCADGYSGPNCTMNIDDCEGIVCDNGGTCMDLVNGFRCNCAVGYSGQNCETPTDPCAPMPCNNGGTCTSDGVQFTCICPAGYNGTTCNEACPANRFGIDCAMTCSCNVGSCDSVDGTCICLAGFTGSDCVDMCPEGMFGDDCGEVCQCQNGASCDHVDGTCTCTAGYMGLTCSKSCVDSFGVNCSQPCQCQNGDCNNVDGSCSCAIGYTGTICNALCSEGFYGQDCSQTCDCLNGATCSPFNGTCTCAEGYTGTRCETPICTNPCQNGGTCIAPETCQCSEFLGGPTCEVPICPAGYCSSGGTCTAGPTGPTCTCPPTHRGDRCQFRNRGSTGRVESDEESELNGGQKAGISIGAIFGFVLIGVVVALVTFFGYRYWKRKGSLKTAAEFERNGSPVYFEASESTSSDPLGKGAIDNPVYGVYSKPIGNDVISLGNVSGDVLLDHPYENKRYDPPPITSDDHGPPLNDSDAV